MSRGGQILKATFIYFIGNFSSRLLTFFLLPLYTAYLTTEDFGLVDLFMSALPLMAPIFTLQVTETVFRFLYNEDSDKIRKRTITNSLLIFFFGILIFVVFYIPFILEFQMSYAIWFFLYFTVTCLGMFLQQLLRGLKRTIEYAVMGVMATLANAVLNVILIIHFSMGGESLLISSTGGSMVVATIIILRIKIWRLIDIKLLSKVELKRQLRYGLPLIPNQICWWMISLMGKYILMYFWGTGENGILAVASKFPSLLTAVSSIFFLAWTENIIREFQSKDKDEYFSKGFELFLKFSLSAMACLLPAIKVFNISMLSGEFLNSWEYVPLMLIGALFNSLSTFLGTIYTASMETTDAFTTTVVAAVTNLILCIIMTPAFSIWGIVTANMLAFIALFLVRIKSVKKIISFTIKIKNAILNIIFLIISLIMYYYLNTVSQIVFFILAIICSLFFNKEFILEFVKILQRFRQ